MIRRHEGYRGAVYKDINGNPTGGYGHCFAVGSKLPQEIWEQIFQHDIKQAVGIVSKLGVPEDVLNEVRRGILIDMAFNLGGKLFDFHSMLAALRKRDFKMAAWHMEKTLWAKQVGSRAKELIEMMKTGVLPEGFK